MSASRDVYVAATVDRWLKTYFAPDDDPILFDRIALSKALWKLLEREHVRCPGHVASATDPKRCGRCGIHIDELRPDDQEIG